MAVNKDADRTELSPDGRETVNAGSRPGNIRNRIKGVGGGSGSTDRIDNQSF